MPKHKPLFENRKEAGQKLALALTYLIPEKPIVIALPRGGVPVAFEVAEKLGAPLDVLIVRKLGAPDNPEYGIGAVTEEGLYWINEQAVRELEISKSALFSQVELESAHVTERVKTFRGGRRLIAVKDRTVILVDDGLATGVSARVATRFLRHLGAKKIVLAVPVGAPESCAAMEQEVDAVVCLDTPKEIQKGYWAVGAWYQDFTQVTDSQVVEQLVSRSPKQNPIKNPATGESPLSSSLEIRVTQVKIPTGEFPLLGTLSVPTQAKGLVLFAHGSGSSRLSPRNIYVAECLQRTGIATLLFDLLSEQEAQDRAHVFDIPLLGERLITATRWAQKKAELSSLKLGYFGASTGAAAALWGASRLQTEIATVVSRGGRPDLAQPVLSQVRASTLLIVGGEDAAVLTLNREALKHLTHGSLLVIPGATHLFEEPGTLENAAQAAASWFESEFELSKAA